MTSLIRSGSSARIFSVSYCIAAFMLALPLLSAFLFIAPGARAQSDDADKILKALSEYLASQKNISLSAVPPVLQRCSAARHGNEPRSYKNSSIR